MILVDISIQVSDYTIRDRGHKWIRNLCGYPTIDTGDRTWWGLLHEPIKFWLTYDLQELFYPPNSRFL
jgi:hypothetical protein